jgi:F-type H+-transporting ATPase subunit c
MTRVLTLLAVALATAVASDAQAAEAAAAAGRDFLSIGAGIGLGLAALGGGLGQGRLVAAALEGIARNPSASGKMQIPMILGLAFVESLVLLTFIVAFFIQGKI